MTKKLTILFLFFSLFLTLHANEKTPLSQIGFSSVSVLKSTEPTKEPSKYLGDAIGWTVGGTIATGFTIAGAAMFVWGIQPFAALLGSSAAEENLRRDGRMPDFAAHYWVSGGICTLVGGIFLFTAGIITLVSIPLIITNWVKYGAARKIEKKQESTELSFLLEPNQQGDSLCGIRIRF